MKKNLHLNVVWLICIVATLLLTACDNGALSASRSTATSSVVSNSSMVSTAPGVSSTVTGIIAAASTIAPAASGTVSAAAAVDAGEQRTTAPSITSVEKDTSEQRLIGEVVEIRDKMFIAQTNDIYLNALDYLGKTIKLEGMFKVAHDAVSDDDYFYVVRYGPGCCGYDANPGFEVAWENSYPEDEAWVEACGILEYYVENGAKLLRLKLTSLQELEVRGQEYVNQ